MLICKKESHYVNVLKLVIFLFFFFFKKTELNTVHKKIQSLMFLIVCILSVFNDTAFRLQ